MFFTKCFLVSVAIFSVSVIACTRTLIMGTNETNWPSNITQLSENYSGAELRAIKLIFENSDFCIDIHYVPSLARVHKELKAGRIDFTFSASYTKERAEYGYFSLPYRLEVMKLFKHVRSPSIKTLEEVFEKNYTVAINRGSYYGPEVAEYKKHFTDQIAYTSNANNRADMLSKHRVDYSIEELRVVRPFLKKYDNILVVKNIDSIYNNPVHFMLSKKSVSLKEVEIINRLIKNKQPEVDKIYERY